MSTETTYFDLVKPAESDSAAIEQINGNMDIIDAEMHKPPLTVNGVEPNTESRDIQLTTVPLADNLTSSEAQLNTGTYIIRSSGGEASISNGAAWLNEIQGNMVKTGNVEQSVDMTLSVVERENPITATINEDTFIEAASGSSGTMVFSYTNAWSTNPALYGITVSGTPVDGDEITVAYVKTNRGTITTANPSAFVSTGWNLYNHAAGYARVVNYSEEYGFMVNGSYTALAFAETLSGEQTAIEPVNGFFTLPYGKTSGYIFVTGGNATNTEIWMTWGDWTEQANGGTFEAYTQTTIDLSEVMVLFPYGLMRVGNYYDEINLNTLHAYSRIERMAYNDTNLAAVIASGVPYDTDTGYIFAVKEEPDVYTISVEGEYTASDHGTEFFTGTTVPVTAQSLYGNDLKGKLQRDVVTLSQQTLTEAQKAQVISNIGAVSIDTMNAFRASFGNLYKYIWYPYQITGIADGAGLRLSANTLGVSNPSGYKPFALVRYTSGSYKVPVTYVNILATGNDNVMGFWNSSGATQGSAQNPLNAGVGILYIKTGTGMF